MWDKDGPAMILSEKPDLGREGDLGLPLSCLFVCLSTRYLCYPRGSGPSKGAVCKADMGGTQAARR